MKRIQSEIERLAKMYSSCQEGDSVQIEDAYRSGFSKALNLYDINTELNYSEREIDLAYLMGVFNVSGIDGLQKEIERLKGIDKSPHDIFTAERRYNH
jgi:hypothetical protein